MILPSWHSARHYLLLSCLVLYCVAMWPKKYFYICNLRKITLFVTGLCLYWTDTRNVYIMKIYDVFKFTKTPVKAKRNKARLDTSREDDTLTEVVHWFWKIFVYEILYYPLGTEVTDLNSTFCFYNLQFITVVRFINNCLVNKFTKLAADVDSEIKIESEVL